jgi:RNA polymerase sigma-70 factor (ECF subfamily)
MSSRTNKEWLRLLTESGEEERNEALQELQDYLLRAALVYLASRRGELAEWGREAVRALAEDLVQESLEDIRQALAGFRGESKFTTWAYRFAINRAASELRRQRYRDLSLDRLREDRPALFQSLLGEQGLADPEQLSQRKIFLELIFQIVDEELEPRDRTAILAVFWEGRPMDEVAASLGLNRNALYKLLHDARKRIKAKLLAHHLTEGDILGAFRD